MPVSNSVSADRYPLARPLDCIRTMQSMIDLHDHVERFLLGESAEKPRLAGTCHKDCPLGKHLRDVAAPHAGGDACLQCADFHAQTSHAVLMKEQGRYSSEGELLCAVQNLRTTSERLQEHLVDWHLQHPIAA